MLDPKNIGPGQEQHEVYKSSFPKVIKGKRTYPTYCAYDYRDHDGELFSCIAPGLEEARAKRDRWLEKRAHPA